MADEFINKRETIENLKKFAPEHLTPLIEQLVEKQPTVDVVEVKHGEWIDDIQKFTSVSGSEVCGIVGYKCSLCGRREGKKEPYCNCGAKMDG